MVLRSFHVKQGAVVLKTQRDGARHLAHRAEIVQTPPGPIAVSTFYTYFLPYE
jgi:hypothetical protein